jgi:hypothetical protein
MLRFKVMIVNTEYFFGGGRGKVRKVATTVVRVLVLVLDKILIDVQK